ncbi:MAG: hypothetical protein ABIH11_04715 [Candidatus Altiarchaeota archaeon]
MFVRKKRIKGREYYYLVKSVRRDGRVSQEFVEYLGSEAPSPRQLAEVKTRHDKGPKD